MGAPAVVSGRMKDNACSWQLRAPYRIALCALALATIMMVTCNLTKDIPSLPESDASTDMQILMQVQEDMEAADDDSSFLYNQGSSSLRNQDGVKKFFKKRIDSESICNIGFQARRKDRVSEGLRQGRKAWGNK